MLAIPGISKRTGVTIKRYDFSDAQSGKDICDRRIANAKSHMRRYLNEGNDIKTAFDMKKALDSYGGVKGCRASVVSVDPTKQQISTHKWTGITSFSNFEFNKAGVRVWKAYNIGKGQFLKKKDLLEMAPAQGNTGLKTHEPFTDPEKDIGILKKPSIMSQIQSTSIADPTHAPSEQETDLPGFYCPDAACVKVFVTNKGLERHLDTGKHFYRLQTKGTYDTVKEKWALACTSVVSYNELPTSTDTQQQTTASQQGSVNGTTMGWALRKPAPKKRFSKPLKEFLLKTFLDGEKTGIKANAKDVSQRIKSMKKDGKKMFEKSEWLSTQQVKSYFSRLTALLRRGKLANHEDEDDGDIEVFEEAMIRQKLHDCVRENVEF